MQDYKDINRILKFKMKVKNELMPNHLGHTTHFTDMVTEKKQTLSFLDNYGNKMNQLK